MRTDHAAALAPAPDLGVPAGSDWRELLWITLIIIPTFAALLHSAQ